MRVISLVRVAAEVVDRVSRDGKRRISVVASDGQRAVELRLVSTGDAPKLNFGDRLVVLGDFFSWNGQNSINCEKVVVANGDLPSAVMEVAEALEV